MSQISSKELDNKTLKRIYGQLVKTISDLGSIKYSEDFTEEFFTETEQIMFAKRLAIILLLSENFSWKTIEKILKVTPATISRIAKVLDGEGYQFAKRIVHDKKLKEKFWLDLEVILRGGLPPIGKGRWKFLDEYKK